MTCTSTIYVIYLVISFIVSFFLFGHRDLAMGAGAPWNVIWLVSEWHGTEVQTQDCGEFYGGCL